MVKDQQSNFQKNPLPIERTLFADMIQNLKTPLWICDKEGVILLINDQALEYVSGQREETIGRL